MGDVFQYGDELGRLAADLLIPLELLSLQSETQEQRPNNEDHEDGYCGQDNDVHDPASDSRLVQPLHHGVHEIFLSCGPGG